VINYAALVMFLLLFSAGERSGWTGLVIGATLVSLALALISFVIVHIKTRLWKLVHTKEDRLDERQIQVTHYSLRYAYGIFSVISLAVLLVLALLAGRSDSVLIMVFACLLYLAHTLPSAILAWTEKEV
jgi:ABC-type Fe3+ transport system permease subunit